MASEFYGNNGTIHKDSNSFVVTSTKTHNVSTVHADKVYANTFIDTSVPESVTASGDLSLSSTISYIDTTGGVLALTLADGTFTGQTKVVVHAAGTNAAVLTPDNLWGGTTVTTRNVGVSYTLTWLNGAWALTANGGNQVGAYASTTGASVPTRTLPTGDMTAAQLTNVLKQLVADLGARGLIDITITP